MNLTKNELNLLKHLIVEGVHRASETLREMLQTDIYLDMPENRTYLVKSTFGTLLQTYHQHFSVFELDFKGAFRGKTALVFPAKTVESLTKLLVEIFGTEYDLESVKYGAINEMSSVLINSVMGEITASLEAPLDYALPQFVKGDADAVKKSLFGDAENMLVIQTRFVIEEYNVREDVLLIFEAQTLQDLMEAIRLNKETGEKL